MPEHLELQHLVEFSSGSVDENSSSLYEDRRPLVKRCPFIGLLLATLSSLFFSLCSVIVKGLVTVDPMELAAFRFVGVLLPALPVVLWRNEPIFPKGRRVMLALRSFVGTSGLMLSFYAFRNMPLADASIIVFSVPVFVSIFAKIFLKEPCEAFNVVSIILTLVGVLLITRPTILPRGLWNVTEGAPAAPGWGALAAFGSTLFGASVYVLLRALKGVHFSVIMTSFGGFALIQTLLVSWLSGALCMPQCGLDRLLVLCLAFFSFTGQILLTMSLQLEQAGPIAIARSADIVFAFIWQIMFFNEIPNGYSVMGAVLVLFSVLLVGLRKWALALPPNSVLKAKLGFMAR